MNVSFKNNVLTVVTDIAKETIEKGIASLKARDEKGNEVYAVSLTCDGNANIDNFGIRCNTFVNGKAAAIMVLPFDVTLTDVQRVFGKALVAANKYTAQIAAQASAEEETIAALFVEDENEACDIPCTPCTDAE